MIPKIIHYCWLSGDEYPDKIKYCINSWKKKLPGYEFFVWDTIRFDLSSSIWCQEAFDAKKYAFAADYLRCYALYNYGGIYLDSDVEVIKPFDDLLDLPYFIGKERKANLEPAIMGAEKGWHPLSLMLDYYKGRHFKDANGGLDMTTMPVIMDSLLNQNYTYKVINSKADFDLDENVLSVFEADFFSPKYSNVSKIDISPNTYSVHHFEASWFPVDKKTYRLINKFFGPKIAKATSCIYKQLKRMLFKEGRC